MNNNFKIPMIYQKMHERGYTSIENYLWLNEMEWMPIDSILEYEHDKGESELIIPFAFTGGGDKWVWVINDENREYSVGICEHVETNGVYYAKNMEDAVLRHIIEYVSDSNFYLVEYEADCCQISEKELKRRLDKWKNSFRGIINDEYISIIEKLGELSLKHIKCQYGEWYALLTLEEEDELIDRYIKFDLLDKEFEWYIE